MARAAVVQLDPLRVEDIIDFLADPSPVRDALWQPVVERLQEQPDGVLASALSSPLLLGLAKDSLAAREIRALSPMTTRSEVSTLIIDGFIAVAYGAPAQGRRPPPTTGVAPLRFSCCIEMARQLSLRRVP